MPDTIGIRANPNAVYYCVLNDTADSTNVKIVDKVLVPKALEIPEQLKFIRNTFKDIFIENNVKNACIRVTESNAQSTSILRIYLEGVLQELIASSMIEKYFIGQISNISTKLGIERSAFKPFVAGESNFNGLDIWQDWDAMEREAVLAAFAANNL